MQHTVVAVRDSSWVLAGVAVAVAVNDAMMSTQFDAYWVCNVGTSVLCCLVVWSSRACVRPGFGRAVLDYVEQF